MSRALIFISAVGVMSSFNFQRRRSGLLLAWLAVLVLLLPLELRGVPAARFTHISVEQGLSQNTVEAILQDHVGFLWFGTEEGLNRYDGYTFVVYKHDPGNPQSLCDDTISALHEDRQSRLWIGAEHGLCLFDRRTETFAPVADIHTRVTAIVEDPDGTLWVGAEGQGLFERNPKTGEFILHQHDARDPGSLASSAISALFRDHAGRLWIGTRYGGVDLLGKGGNRFIHYRHDPRNLQSLSGNEVWSVAEDGAGNVWVATYGGGLSVLDHATGVFRHYRHRPGDGKSLPTNFLTCLFVDHSGTLWIGTEGAGVQQYNSASNQFVPFQHNPSNPSSLSENVIRTIYEDVQGQLWVGTYLQGANLLKKPRAFGYFSHSAADPSSLGEPAVASFLEDTEGRIWVGTEGGWLNRFDRQTGTFAHYRFPPSLPSGSAVLSLHQDHLGRIWVGTYRGGLGQFDPRHGTFTVYKHRPNDPKSLADDEVWAIVEDGKGALWLGTNAGLDRFDPDNGAVISHYDAGSATGLSHNEVRSLLLDRQRNLWVGTLVGLNLLRPGSGSFVHYLHDGRNPRSLSHDEVVSLCEDRQGRLWVGTYGGGVNRLGSEAGEFNAYKDFPSNTIYGIQEDSSGRLWVSTNHGLSRFDPATGTIENFDLSNGLQSLQFHIGASLRTRSGRMLFGSAEGFYDFDPEAIKPDTYAPPVVLTSLRTFNEPAKLPAALSALDQITLTHQDKVFSLEFAALDYALPRRNRYAYFMEGFSGQWIPLGTRREVTFTNLDPGTYVFKVKASNSDGVWNEASAAKVKVIVRPPFWKTWWFRGLSAAMFGLLLLGVHRVRVRRLTSDIADRKRAQEALRQSDERYRAFVRSSSEAIWRFELEKPFPISLPEEEQIDLIFEHAYLAECNDVMAKMYGFSRAEEFVGRPIRDFFVPSETNVEFLRSFIRSGYRIAGAESHERGHDGNWKWFLNNHIAIIEEGQLIRFWGTQRDITERKRTEEALHRSEEQLRQAQKMEAVGRLAGGIAHDFNNLLNVIAGYTELMLYELPEGAPLRGNAENIRSASDKAAALTRQLLAFGRKQVVAPRVVDLNAVLRETGEFLPRLIGEDIQIAVHTSAEEAFVRIDPVQMQQIILNLALNARDAMPEGGSLIIETECVDLNDEFAGQRPPCALGRYVRLSVSDTGTGIPQEIQEHIFEPFFTTKELGKGTGLGLATVYGIVQQSGGGISLYSEPGMGTTFKIYLPRVEEGIETAPAQSLSEESLRGTETILLVEDQEQLRLVMTAFLEKQGYTVLPTSYPSEALDIARHRPEIDLLLTDVVMPGMHGPELAQQISQLSPQIKILFLSGYAPDSIKNGPAAAFSFLEKPVGLKTLARKLREMLAVPRAA